MNWPVALLALGVILIALLQLVIIWILVKTHNVELAIGGDGKSRSWFTLNRQNRF